MKKIQCIILLIIISLFISGCSVDYKLDMSKDTIKEDITVEFKKSECNDGEGNCEEYARNLLNSVIETEDYPNYSLDYSELGNDAKVQLSYTYSSMHDFIMNNIYNSSYNNVEINNDTFILSSNSETNEEALDTKYKVTIIPKKKIKRNNADKKEGNKYIWEFTSADKNKDIMFSYKFAGKLDSNTKKNTSEVNTMYFILIVGAISLIVIIIISFYSRKNKKVNKI